MALFLQSTPLLAEMNEANFEVLDQIITVFFPDEFDELSTPPESPALLLLRHKEGFSTLNAMLLAHPPVKDLSRAKNTLENDYRAVGFHDATVERIQQTVLPPNTRALEAEIHFHHGSRPQVAKTLTLLYKQHQILFTFLYDPEYKDRAEPLWQQIRSTLKAPPSDFPEEDQTQNSSATYHKFLWLILPLLALLIVIRLTRKWKNDAGTPP